MYTVQFKATTRSFQFQFTRNLSENPIRFLGLDRFIKVIEKPVNIILCFKSSILQNIFHFLDRSSTTSSLAGILNTVSFIKHRIKYPDLFKTIHNDFDFEQSNENERQQSSGVHKPIYLKFFHQNTGEIIWLPTTSYSTNLWNLLN